MLFKYGESMETKVDEVLYACDDFIDLAFKASGSSIIDLISGMDETTGALIGGGIKMYDKSKELLKINASVIDKILGDLEEIKETNELLMKQNKELLKLLQKQN